MMRKREDYITTRKYLGGTDIQTAKNKKKKENMGTRRTIEGNAF